jgi:hypothetical protein
MRRNRGADRRSALRLLAGSPDGQPLLSLLLRGITVGLLAELTVTGLIISHRGDRDGATRVKLTDAGRKQVTETIDGRQSKRAAQVSSRDRSCRTADTLETIDPTRGLESAVRDAMTLMLRRVRWPPDNSYSLDPEDYRVYDGDRKIGWICRLRSTGSPRWEWGIDYEMGKGKQGGIVDSLEEAKATFKAAWKKS